MGMFSRAWAAWRRQSRHFVGEDLQGNRYFEIPGQRTDLVRSIRRVEYGQASHDVVQNANRARQLPVQWTSWLSHTRPDPPTIQELQKDILRRQRLLQNVQMIEARDREERERLALEQSETLRLAPGDERATAQSASASWPQAPVREEPKPVEDPWEKARKEAGPDQPSAWQPQARRR
ncbi:hypothetical protein BDV93DRAFT_518030 [Ceratobasidium sp. AG-I]|nr:hypothetical protein BDV93DRAFT_518030 [Ceratobasidium sp. AG-I]